MIGRRLLTASLLLPLVAISGAALAGPNISDKRYWPSEARSEAAYEAFALQGNVQTRQAVPSVIVRQPAPYTYQGEPKSGLATPR